MESFTICVMAYSTKRRKGYIWIQIFQKLLILYLIQRNMMPTLKEMLADKQILSRILKYTLDEFSKMDIEDTLTIRSVIF